MAALKTMDIHVLRQLLAYTPETGELFWRARDRAFFKCEPDYLRWNTRYSGKPALAYQTQDGYLSGRIFDTPYKAHRVGWAIHFGEWPSEVIDHINGVGTDNRISNLRAVSRLENQQNLARRKTNKSGVTGVSWDSRNGKWLAQISVNKTHINLGRFDNFDDAIISRKSAEENYGFHKNHGRVGPISQ
jgi:hypothetical protein